MSSPTGHNMKTIILTFTTTILTLLVTSCDSAIDAAIDCIDNDGPGFLTASTLPAATVDLEYDMEIVAAVTNEPRDDRFDYEFTLQGHLPDGVFLETFGFSRRAYLRGTPTEPREYRFILSVEVVENAPWSTPNETSHLCFTRHREEFTLIVLPAP